MEASAWLRLKALGMDYLWLVAYLVVLLGGTMGFYYGVLGSMPEVSMMGTQLISFFTTVFPVTLYYTWRESKAPYQTFGKHKVGISIHYEGKGNRTMKALVRNALKFLPWQIAHIAVIRGIYEGFDSPLTLTLYAISILLPIVYVAMVFVRKDNRHLPDLAARCRIVLRNEESV